MFVIVLMTEVLFAGNVYQEVVLDTIMEFVKLGNGGNFYSAIYHRLIQAAVSDKLVLNIYFYYINVFFSNLSISLFMSKCSDYSCSLVV